MGEYNIQTMEILQGDLPDRAQKLVREWIDEHREELQTMQDNQQIRKPPPLE